MEVLLQVLQITASIGCSICGLCGIRYFRIHIRYRSSNHGRLCNGSVLDCDDDGSVGTRSELAYPVDGGESYIVVIDGYSSTSTGDYQLDIDFTSGVDCSGAELDCGDGVDNDGDGDIDCDDSDCASQQICNESDCTDGVDNEGDGLIDCDDPDCAADAACFESDCTDGIDNDTGAADGLIDCDDSDCALDPACFEYTCM